MGKAKQRQYEYSKKREAQHLEWILKQDRNFLQEVNDQLRYAMEQSLKEAGAWVSKYSGKEGISPADALKLASTADIKALAEKAKIYVPAKDFSDVANNEMRLYNYSMKMSRQELLLREMDLESIRAFRSIDKAMESYLSNMTMAELQRQSGILGMTVPSQAELEALSKHIANGSFHNAHFSDRIWEYQGELLRVLNEGITKSILLGRNPTTWMHELRRNLAGGFNGSAHAMKRLAVTESARVQIEAQKASYINGGYSKFMVICEPTACQICMPYDGKEMLVVKMSIGSSAPPFHPNCKCSTTAAYSDEQYKKNMDEFLEANERKTLENSIIGPDNKFMFPDKLAGVNRDEPMDPEQANSGNPNPHYNDAPGYRVNCQSCVVTYEARLRGYDVSTLPKRAAGDQLSRKTNLAWIDPISKTHPEYIFDETANTPKRLYKFLEDKLDPSGRYTIEFAWKGRRNSGHIISLSKSPEGGLSLYDPQTGGHYHNEDVEIYFGRLQLQFKIPALKLTVPRPAKVLRVDDKEFNLDLVNQIMEEFGK